MNNFIRKFFREVISTKWNIGFVEIDANDGILSSVRKNSIHWLKHNFKNRWFADPFILSTNEDEIEVLVEEWIDEERKGRISKLTIARADFSLKKITPILSLKTHLSFPFISRVGKDIFVMPENCASGKLFRYIYNRKSEKLVLDQEWGKVDAPMTDTIVIPQELSKGKEVLFSTEFLIAGGASGKILGVYERNSNKCFERTSEIIFADRSARSAGAVFRDEGRWIRPAQDCNKRYGHGLVFQEIKRRENSFCFQDLFRIFPHSSKWNLGIHTFNISENKSLATVDGYRYRTILIGHILGFFKIGTILSKLQSRFLKQRN